MACAATVLGFLGQRSWVLDLFSHFRVQYLAGLAVLGAVLLAGRRRRAAVVLLGFAAVNAMTLGPLYVGRTRTPSDDMPRLRAMLINVNTRRGDPARVSDAIREADPDILVLQEISSAWLSHLTWLRGAYPYAVVHPRDDNFGIGLFSRLPFIEQEVRRIGSAAVPSVLATLQAGDRKLRVVATHPVPPVGRAYFRWRNEQLERLPDAVRSPHPVLLLGDLNITPWNHRFRRLLAGSGLRDSARGYGVQPTWPRGQPLLRIPLDHCLHSEEIAILDRRVGPDVSSDHFPLVVDFVISQRAIP